MSNDADIKATSASNEISAAQAVQQLVQFARIVRYRKNVVLLALVAAGALGGLYYATATRYYEARASLLILQAGNDVLDTSMKHEGMTQSLMPTYERLLTSAVVLQAAVLQIGAEDQIDFEGVAPDRRAEQLAKNLRVSTARRTNMLEVSYRSRSPRAAVVVVNAVLKSYLDFMEKTHKGTAGDIIGVLSREKVQLEQRLSQKEFEVLNIRGQFGDMGIRNGDKVVHPVVQRAVQLNEALIEAQKKRLQFQASLAAIQGSLARGEDLQQHILSIEAIVGQQFLLAGLGFNDRDTATRAAMEKSMVEDQAELRSLQEYYGPAHPRITELVEKIKITESYLTSYDQKIREKLAQVREKQLGPLLMQMVQQRLSETWQHEQSLRQGFEQARQEAVNLNGKLAQLEIAEQDLKWLRALRETLLNQIASIDLQQDQGDIRTAVVAEPQLPDKAVSPRLSIVGMLSLMAGLLAGLMLVFAQDALDDRFRSPDELRMQLGIPVLAMIRKLENLAPTGLNSLQVHVAPQEVQSEAFRTLRTTLAFAGQQTSRIVVSSAEPGDGKTTVLANLAVSFAQAGKRTLLIDADMRRPGLTSLLELRSQSGLSDVLRSEEHVADAARTHIKQLDTPGLDVLPCGPRPANPAELLASVRFCDLIAWAETVYDQILVDGPPSLAASDSAIIGRLMDGVVLVVRPDKNQRRLVMRAVESFSSLGVTMLGVVINRVASEKGHDYYEYNYGVGYGYGYGGGYGYGEEGVAEAGATVGNAESQPAPESEEEQPSTVRMPARRVA